MKKQKERLLILGLVVFMSLVSYTYVNYSYNNNPEIEKLTIDEIDNDNLDDVDVGSKLLILTIEKVYELMRLKM